MFRMALHILTIEGDALMYMLLAVSIVIAATAYICLDNELDVAETVQKIAFNGSIASTLYIGISVLIPDLIFR